MFEQRHEPLLPFGAFLLRWLRFAAAASVIVGMSLAVGVAGYHVVAGFGWVDAVLEAAMILGGMGPIHPLEGTAAKLFAAAYALFAGVVFLVAAGVFFAPVIHRLFHYFHLEPPGDD
ncbi:MAG: hypothetical protein RMK15_06225 [Chloroflexota bacterium]|nr:hypothetical protein [Dehalococcoidia bacterium]MDW8046862.1 hypothetical protein [Chloroflexota bacterium]